MALIGGKQAVGLDVGQSSVKLVQVGRKGKRTEILRRETFDARQEGILDEQELYGAATSWLKELGLSDEDFSVGLPQYFATTQVSDFPPNVSGDELDEMVTYETVQLAGLSDEAFISDYHVMSPEFGRKNPVLIGICRESVVRDRADMLSDAGLSISELAMNGLASVNALFYLHPEAAEESSPQLVLDVGVESTTLLVIAAGQILHTGSLMVGGSRFDDAIAAHLNCTPEEAERIKSEMAINAADHDSPLLQAVAALQNEIHGSIEHWRAGESEEVATRMITKIWLCGGGAALKGLPDYLGRIFGCEVNVFGPPDENGMADPRQSTALGLALQGLGGSAISVSLCPEEIRWVRQRRSRFGYLLGAAAIAVLLIAAGLFKYNQRLETQQRQLAGDIRNLKQCEQIIPKLEENLQLMRHYEKMMVPIVEKGNRGRRFLQSIDVLGTAQGEENWFIYLGDQFSFEEGKPRKDADDTPAQPPPPAADGMFPGAISSLDAPDESVVPASSTTLVTNMERLRSMILAGHSPKKRRDSLQAVREIQRRLNDSALFQGVDLLPRPQREGREREIFNPWLVYMTSMAEQNVLGAYISFMFRLPFADVDVFAVEPEAKQSRSS